MTHPRTAGRPRREIGVLAIVCVLAGSMLIGACSSDGSSKPAATTPEAVKAPMSEVVAKLPTMVAKGNEAKVAAAAGDYDKASSEFDELHEVWEEVEGTVKDTNADIYEKIETAQGLIKDGAEAKIAARVATGASDQAAAVQQFVDANK